MELIYTDANKKDIGVINAATFDLAFGVDENNFELTIPKKNHCCEAGSIIYIEGEEYGGIVDDIELTTSDDMIKYTGRTFHGILNAKIIEPPKGCDYLTLYGDANEVLAQLIDFLDLNDLFKADTKSSGIAIAAFDMYRYVKGYDGIRKMLGSVSAKLKMKWQGRRAVLYAEPIIDYSVNEEFMFSAVTDMSIKKRYNPVNHIIGLGKGELSERKVIHIFTDENGGITPYSNVLNPVKDSDYILDKRNQQLFGTAEVCDTYDLSNAETVENYILTTQQPRDWAAKFGDYFIQDGADKFKQLASDSEKNYTLQTAKPADWNNAYSNYFIKSGNDYTPVEGTEVISYTKLTAQPRDWNINYGNYFYSDNGVYKSVIGIAKISYKKQTSRPDDWNTNYHSYFVKNYNGAFVNVKAYTAWQANTFYTRLSEIVAPQWQNIYYKKNTTVSAPAWASNKYYTQSSKTVRPSWKRNTYYRLELDNYASIVKGCIEKLEEAWNSDEIDITLNPDRNYDIGDIVGGYDAVTGIFAARQITKKIVKRNSYGNYEISYEEGMSV